MEKLSETNMKHKMVTTKGINEDMVNNGWFSEEIGACLKRHFNNDFGELSKEDIEMNMKALESDLKLDRILSRYKTTLGDIYIISEYYDDNVGILTTTLYCDEY